jgi:hypothetical protein
MLCSLILTPGKKSCKKGRPKSGPTELRREPMECNSGEGVREAGIEARLTSSGG